MLGTYRLALSLMVLVAHLGEGPDYVNHVGVFAVFGFYIVSGFLITYVLRHNYSADSWGFLKNRCLRLYPPYFVILILTLIVIYTIPESQDFHAAWPVSWRLQDWAGNIGIFPFVFGDLRFRIIPPAWSVAVEIVNYFLLWALIARSRTIAIIVLLLAIAWHVVSLIIGSPWNERYFPFYSALLPFSMGSIIYWLRKANGLQLSQTANAVAAAVLACLTLINTAAAGWLGGYSGRYFDAFFYSNVTLMFLLVIACSKVTTSGRLRRADKWLGDLAYPAFLAHWLVGYLVSLLIFGNELTRGWLILLISVPIIIALSLVMNRAIDSIIEPIRDSIRAMAKISSSSPPQ